ncbi:response regulator [Alteromonas sp. KUL49]|uniref:LytR/AlgR family response regulator transcription factor n=1 Tax=Alteromonas sp. KUL49 TaxID=2480798 RepID=UPI00102F01BA|nr:response regulator [Alteromonas sp. KUL49]TAP38012.1 response regulator transcription factor [Alteromonas sp. KUL49]GEA12885.1 DNA-binding response regulator [Alteromonas sp. KUL49]
MLKALIIDDEPLAHQVVLHHLAEHPKVSVAGQYYNATDALQHLSKDKVDLLFLDINMPALSGMQMLRVLANKPQVIIISAYQEFAVEGFELEVTDYLVKPVGAERFNQAMVKVYKEQQLVAATPVSAAPKHIVLKVGREKRKFILEHICYAEAYGNYVRLWTLEPSENASQARMSLVNTTLKQLVADLPDSGFIQVHKSFAVNTAFVIATDAECLTLSIGEQIKIGKSYKKSVDTLL